MQQADWSPDGTSLAIVREIVQQHGGEVSIGDNVYQHEPRAAGTRVRVTLRRPPPGSPA